MTHQRGGESRTAQVCFQSLRRVALVARLKSDDHRISRARSDVHRLYSSWTGPGPSTGIHHCTGLRMNGVIPPILDTHGHAQTPYQRSHNSLVTHRRPLVASEPARRKQSASVMTCTAKSTAKQSVSACPGTPTGIQDLEYGVITPQVDTLGHGWMASNRFAKPLSPRGVIHP
jgi:hypothetical protein